MILWQAQMWDILGNACAGSSAKAPAPDNVQLCSSFYNAHMEIAWVLSAVKQAASHKEKS
jgi:hypothetical protein